MNKQKLLQFFRFSIGSSVGVAAYWFIFYTLTEFAGVWYVTSSVIASILKRCIIFVVQKLWTFKNKDVSAIPGQVFQYILMAVGITSLNSFFLYTLVEYFYLKYLIAQALLVIPLSILSFLVTRRIFMNKPQPNLTPEKENR